MLKIKVILGSTRENRVTEKPAHWIFEEIKKRENIEAELLDLREYPMPFFNEAVTPSASKGQYSNETVKKWAAKIAEADGFIVVTPEYNHGYPAVLKNALDYVYYEWNRKPIGFVAHGSVGGARSVEQLRLVSIELQMAPIRPSIHLKAPVTPELMESLKERVESFFDQLIWWAEALKSAREK